MLFYAKFYEKINLSFKNSETVFKWTLYMKIKMYLQRLHFKIISCSFLSACYTQF